MKRKPATSLSPFTNPLVVQFWLFGLDASGGLLRARGFERVPELRGGKAYGSSRYCMGDLELHSSGLCLRLPTGVLSYTRPRQSFTLGAEPLSRPEALKLLQPHLHEHEAWTERQRPGLRTRQLACKLPRPVREQLGAWHAWVTDSLEPLIWQPQFWQPGKNTTGAGLSRLRS